MKVLVTGGAGYIGSHTVLELLTQSHDVFILDNFSNSSPEAIRRVQLLADKSCTLVNLDIRDTNKVISAFQQFEPDCVIHFAGLKSVGDSVRCPLDYYDCNFFGALSLIKAMDAVGCEKIIFSSSATVYGEPKYLPLDEEHPCAPVNPYGRTKLYIERMLQDWVIAGDRNSAIILRYFNPVGAHSSGLIGENPKGIPNNLMPYIADVAIGKRPHLNIFGNDYATRDGTGERDYIHVVDLAKAHVAAISKTLEDTAEVFNVGTGSGTTVLELAEEFRLASGRELDLKIVERRSGDVAITVASVDKAFDQLGWAATHNIKDMCRDAWRWQFENPNGYDDEH
jgi:UDP-glucose 4-epimerase